MVLCVDAQVRVCGTGQIKDHVPQCNDRALRHWRLLLSSERSSSYSRCCTSLPLQVCSTRTAPSSPAFDTNSSSLANPSTSELTPTHKAFSCPIWFTSAASVSSGLSFRLIRLLRLGRQRTKPMRRVFILATAYAVGRGIMQSPVRPIELVASPTLPVLCGMPRVLHTCSHSPPLTSPQPAP